MKANPGTPRARAVLGQVSDMDLRLLQVFKAVVECGGMAAAELELNIGISTVSRHVKDLETRLGLVLCRRGRAGFALTAEGQRVYDEATGTTAPVQREATVHDLLRHTAGLSYAWEAGTVPDAYRTARIGSRRHSNAELAAALGPLPLVHQPGTRWEYSRATDVLGAVLEVIEGESLGALLQRRVFGPLGMHDTGFAVPAAQQHRLAEPFARDPQTGLEVALIDVTAPPAFESAGGGLVSTASDYARFLQLMLGRGTAPGRDGPNGTSGNDAPVRLLGRATVDFMTADHLGNLPVAGDILPTGYGFGLGVAVRTATGQATRPGSAGHYSWSGLGGTFFFVDPAEDLFAILLTQAPGQLRYLCELYPTLVYAAL